MIEVMRVLKAAHIKLNRTVRIALWSGEEQGIYGSKAYVKTHFGPEADKFDVYLNLDNGSGRFVASICRRTTRPARFSKPPSSRFAIWE
jgi:Zn-dependent M28 family amino/carboxypeptidase